MSSLGPRAALLCQKEASETRSTKPGEGWAQDHMGPWGACQEQQLTCNNGWWVATPVSMYARASCLDFLLDFVYWILAVHVLKKFFFSRSSRRGAVVNESD